MEFQPWPKTPRLNREVIITEKIDGTNEQIAIVRRGDLPDSCGPVPTATAIVHAPLGGQCEDDLIVYAGSRKRWVTPENDNFGFAAWVRDNAQGLVKLGPGRHFGEWWGKGIQRGYDLDERRFSLFNVSRWTWSWDGEFRCQEVPCCHVVPVLGRQTGMDLYAVEDYFLDGCSVAAPGFPDPEGVIVYHTAANQAFKVLLENDDTPKGAT